MGPAALVIPNVEVLLATWNGAPYLEQQLESLQRQSLKPTRVLMNDDGSTDGTLSILNRWIKAHRGWIKLLAPLHKRLGPTQAFNRLLLASQAPYIALCDQDDVWHIDRLKTGLQQLQATESKSKLGQQQPLLLHSDATLIDAQGHQLSRSLWQWHQVNPQHCSLVRLAHKNQVTGCTILCNRSLLQCALPIPNEAVLHDWWLALVACQQHGLIACRQRLIAHRRHGANHSGPHKQQEQLMQRLIERFSSRRCQWLCLHQRLGLSWLQRLAWWPQALITLLQRWKA